MTDTFGTPSFLEAFRQPIPENVPIAADSFSVESSEDNDTRDSVGYGRKREIDDLTHAKGSAQRRPTYAEVFSGVRQDSGDPKAFIQLMREFYRDEGIFDHKTIVFSDSLNTELCLQYKAAAEAAGFHPTFGVGTFLTSKLKHNHDDSS